MENQQKKPKKGLFWRIVETIAKVAQKILDLKPTNQNGL